MDWIVEPTIGKGDICPKSACMNNICNQWKAQDCPKVLCLVNRGGVDCTRRDCILYWS